MKKLFIMLLVFAVCFAFASCNKENDDKGESTNTESSETSADAGTTGGSTGTDTPESSEETSGPAAEFQKPKNYASVVLVTINPEIRIYLDEQNKVLAVEPVNEDAADMTKDMELDGKKFDDAVKEIVTAASESGYIKENVTVNFEVEESKSEKVNTTELLNAAENITNTVANELEIEIEVKSEDKTHTHAFSDASCTEPAKCSCGETSGNALGHNYKDGKCTRCNTPDPNAIKFTSVKTKNGKWSFRYVEGDSLYICTLKLNLNPPTVSAYSGLDIELAYAGESPDVMEMIKNDPTTVEFNGKYYWCASGSSGVELEAVSENGDTVTVTDAKGGKMVLTRTSENELKVKSCTENFGDGECNGTVPVGTVLTFAAN